MTLKKHEYINTTKNKKTFSFTNYRLINDHLHRF